MRTNRKPTFSDDDLAFIHLAPTTVIAAVARGELDLNVMARQELANRGLDLRGQWIGFERAARLLADVVSPRATARPAPRRIARNRTRRLR